jgi:predicted dehydrogenase
MINAAIVGLGRWGRALVDSVQGKSDAIRFVAGQTRTRAAAEDFARDKAFALHDAYDALLADPGIDAVVIATPHSQHAEQVMQAIAAGKHVHVEKPLTLERETAAAALAAAERAGRVLAVGYCRRFHPSVGEIRDRLKDGRLGDVMGMVAQHTTSTGQFIPADNWRADPAEAPAGGLTAVGVHALDHMIEFAGPVSDVLCATARQIPGPSDDTTTIMLRFANGATGTIFCSVATATNFSFTLYGSRGLAEITRANLGRFRFVPTSDIPPSGAVVPPPDQVVEHPDFDMLKAQLEAFAHSIATGAPYPMPAGDVLHGMAVFDAIVRSAKSGRVESVA